MNQLQLSFNYNCRNMMYNLDNKYQTKTNFNKTFLFNNLWYNIQFFNKIFQNKKETM